MNDGRSWYTKHKVFRLELLYFPVSLKVEEGITAFDAKAALITFCCGY